MTANLSRLAPALGALVWLASANPAAAQWFPFAGMFRPCPCGPTCAPAYAPVAIAPAGGCSSGTCGVMPTAFNTPCGCAPAMVAQPVTETVMRQVPITEYRQVRQTVKKPVIETTYVEQPVTEYRQVVEQKTVNVPTCSYQDVTECQTVQRNCGQWVTKWHQNQKINPCQYDNRPGLMGEMNRMGFAVRQALTPTQYATREYVQQTVAQQIPTTRRVAIQGTKQVTYNVAHMVPTQTTRKVAVNTMKYIDEEVVVMQPVTVVRQVPTTRTSYRLVPAGSALAVAPSATSTALAPSADPISSAKAPSKTQSATRDNDKNRTSDSRSEEVPVNKSSYRRSSIDNYDEDSREANRTPASKPTIRFVAAKMPDSGRVTGWRPTATASKPIQRSERAAPSITVAENDR